MHLGHVLKHSLLHPIYFARDGKIDAALIDDFVGRIDRSQLRTGAVYTGPKGAVRPELRNARVVFLNSDGAIAEEMKRFAHRMNDRFWKFAGPFESSSLQFAEYAEGEYNRWHVDELENHEGVGRLMTVTLFLTDPPEHREGVFQFKDLEGRVVVPKQEKGSMIAFTTCQNHQVTEVKKGVRRSLTLWISRAAKCSTSSKSYRNH